MVEFQWFFIALSVLGEIDNTYKQVVASYTLKRCLNGLSHLFFSVCLGYHYYSAIFSPHDLLQ